MMNTGIIIIYFGRLPEYFHHFLAACECNRQINWIIFTDQDAPCNSGENIHHKYFDINDFNKLASEKLEFPVYITDSYKLCDFKPVYGLIFEDLLKDYEYWGYCDIDMVLGNLQVFFPDDIFGSYDVISTYERFLSGPFCIYKNNEITKNLFRACPDYKSVLQNPFHLAFDENIPKKNLERFTFKKMFFWPGHLLKEFPSLKKYNFSFAEFRYNYQWYVKQKNGIRKHPADMTEAVFEAMYNKTLNASFIHLLYSDRFFKRIGQKNWKIKWDSGSLTDEISGKEIFAFHYPDSKNNLNFRVDAYDPVKKHFMISESGINND